jgi:2-polyprenyl-3-methyl-5-hydroxy-6-metoxy-1,4-benzoquinol methylase
MIDDASNEPARLNDEVREIWNRNADFWDGRMGEGNDFHKLLIEPSQLRLLNLTGAEFVLDVACGNGQFARKMADLKARVLAIDASERMIENARKRSLTYTDQIEYRVIDCTDMEKLLALGERRFDRAVCTMAMMDMADIEPLVLASGRLLKTGGYFVFSLLHPCFNSGHSVQVMEQHDIGGELVQEYFVKVARYSQAAITKGLAMVGQPVPQYYFHRPLEVLLQPFFSAGFVLDGLVEPSFGGKVERTNLWSRVYQEIPPALVARLRLGMS